MSLNGNRTKDLACFNLLKLTIPTVQLQVFFQMVKVYSLLHHHKKECL